MTASYDSDTEHEEGAKEGLQRSARYPLYVTEKELRRRLGLSEVVWRKAVKELERAGLPKRNPLMAGKRYWPAVQEFLLEYEKQGNIRPTSSGEKKPEANWDAVR